MYKSNKYQWNNNYLDLQEKLLSEELKFSIKLNSIKLLNLQNPICNIRYIENLNNLYCEYTNKNNFNIIFYYSYQSNVIPRNIFIQKIFKIFSYVKINDNIIIIKFLDNQVAYIYKSNNITNIIHFTNSKELAIWIRTNLNLPKELDCILSIC